MILAFESEEEMRKDTLIKYMVSKKLEYIDIKVEEYIGYTTNAGNQENTIGKAKLVLN